MAEALTAAEKRRLTSEARIQNKKLAEMQDVLVEDDGDVRPVQGRSIMEPVKGKRR